MTQADMIEALVVMFNPDFDPTVWQTYLIYLACIIVCAIVMVLPSKILGRISTVFAWLSTTIFFIMIIALPIFAKTSGNYNSAKDMFTSKINQTGWSNTGLVFLLTFLTPCWCISGYDSTGMIYLPLCIIIACAC